MGMQIIWEGCRTACPKSLTRKSDMMSVLLNCIEGRRAKTRTPGWRAGGAYLELRGRS